MRVRKTFGYTNGYVYAVTDYTYHGKMLTHMKRNSDELHFFYDGQCRPAKVSYNGVMYTYLHNLQGDIVGIVDNDGTLVVEYKYNAWGSYVSKTGSMADTLGMLNPFRYRGYIFDEETWMYWLKDRYYYPELHRFIVADVSLGSPGMLLASNAYIYCWNNPIGTADNSGEWPGWITAVAAIATAAVAIAVVVAAAPAAVCAASFTLALWGQHGNSDDSRNGRRNSSWCILSIRLLFGRPRADHRHKSDPRCRIVWLRREIRELQAGNRLCIHKHLAGRCNEPGRMLCRRNVDFHERRP